MTWTLHYTKQAQKDAKKLASSGLKAKAQALLAILEKDPWQNPPPFEKLVGDLSGAYSRRINIQHRLVYQVLEAEKAVKILRLWTHYEKQHMTQLYQSKLFANGSTTLPKPVRSAFRRVITFAMSFLRLVIRQAAKLAGVMLLGKSH